MDAQRCSGVWGGDGDEAPQWHQSERSEILAVFCKMLAVSAHPGIISVGPTSAVRSTSGRKTLRQCGGY